MLFTGRSFFKIRLGKTYPVNEFSICGKTRVTKLENGEISTFEMTAEDFGVKTVKFESIASSKTATENAERIQKILTEEFESPEADFICVNAAAALVVAGKYDDYKKAFIEAKTQLASGKAYEKLQNLVEYQG